MQRHSRPFMGGLRAPHDVLQAAPRLIVGFSDGPGVRFGVRVLEALQGVEAEIHLVMSTAARRAAPAMRGSSEALGLADRSYDDANLAARISSGSFLTAGMVVVACSRRCLVSIAIGFADTLIHRAADVTIKEGRPLTVIARPEILEAAVGQVRMLEGVPGVEVRMVDKRLERNQDASVAEIDGILNRSRLSMIDEHGPPQRQRPVPPDVELGDASRPA
jgi:polyprenyl P-hydroxybenzoate/phenylacrylic acid decarboxylase-like protein